MFINATGFYVPEERVDNQHFLELNGLPASGLNSAPGFVPGLRQKPRKILIR